MFLVLLLDKVDIQLRYCIRNFYVKQDDKFYSFIFLEFCGFMLFYNFFINQNRVMLVGVLLLEVDIKNSYFKQIFYLVMDRSFICYEVVCCVRNV